MQYLPHEIRLASEIATALNDRESLPLHLQYARRYKEEYLRRKLEIVMAKPANSFTTNRAALYVHLVTKGEKKAEESKEIENEPNYSVCPTCHREYE